MSEPVIKAALSHLSDNKKLVAWSILAIVLLALMIAVKEVTTLLFASYLIALILDPLVDKFEEKKIRRGLSIFLLIFLFVVGILAFVGVLIPTLLNEYQHLASVLPGYLETASNYIETSLQKIFNKEVDINSEFLMTKGREFFASLDSENLSDLTKRLSQTVLHGYSFTLTIFNLSLLPFFVFYITKDLDYIHGFLEKFLPEKSKSKVKEIAGEVLTHLQAFFRGQITVSSIMALLYVIGLSIIGLPSALVVGVAAGFLNIVPYLGVAVGLVLALALMLVTSPGWVAILKVLGVFGFVQSLEGFFLTPKIVGDSVGIHPLGVIVALIIGGQLFGLAGMVLAIPGAAGLIVLFKHLWREVEK